MIRRGLVLGCGGTVGGAWQIGALAAVSAHLDWDPRTAQVLIGTSAGSVLATLLGAGVGVSDLVSASQGDATAYLVLRRFFTEPPASLPLPPRPRFTSVRQIRSGIRERDALAAVAGLLPAGRGVPTFLDPIADLCDDGSGWVAHPATWLVSRDLTDSRTVAFGSPDAPPASLRQALHASWAVPGWFRPVKIDGHSYADGGIASTASVDLTLGLDLDELVVIAPMASTGHYAPRGMMRAENVMRSRMSRTLDREIAAAEAAGTRVLRVQPSPAELALMGPNFMNPRRRSAALQAALDHVTLPECHERQEVSQ